MPKLLTITFMKLEINIVTFTSNLIVDIKNRHLH